MKYEPKIVFNPTRETIEFMCGGQLYIFEPGEKKMLDGFVADHALNDLNGPLREYEPETDDKDVTSSDVAYDKMKWTDVVAIASERGVFKPGMSKEATVKALIELDEQGN